MAYKLCSAICEAYQGLEYGEDFLFTSLKIGFRGINFQDYYNNPKLVHTKHHRRMAEIVFNSKDDEVIADLLRAWTGKYDDSDTYGLLELVGTLLKLLIHHRHRISTSLTLRRLVIHSVGYLGPKQVEQVGVEDFITLLDCLSVGVDDISSRSKWLNILLHVIRSPQGRRSLSHPYWEFMVELSLGTGGFWYRNLATDDDLWIMSSLEEQEEWDKLEYWGSSFWLRQDEGIQTTSEGLERMTLSLFRQRPGAVQKLEPLLQRSHMADRHRRLKRLRLVCERADLEVVPQQDIP